MIEQAPPRELSGQLVTYELDLDHQEGVSTGDRPPRRIRTGPMLALLAFAVGLALGAAASVQRHSAGLGKQQRRSMPAVATLRSRSLACLVS